MTRAQSPMNRFFVSSDYSLFYRRAKQFDWQNQVSADFSLLLVLTGELTCKINEQTFNLSAQESIIIDPNTSIAIKGRQLEFFFLTLAPSLVLEHAIAMKLITPQSTVSFSLQPHKLNDKLNTLTATFISELLDEKPGKEIVLHALTEQAVVHLLRNYASSRRSDELELSRVGLVDRRIRRSVELMHSQLDQDLSLRELAAASYLSPFHFSRLFKKITGATPHNYLAAVRATRAQLLLAETEMSITEVGARVGYLSASHFTKAFRLATGTTPREFRKALVKN
ncbi:MAG TPA: helix-turn-helix domain-containing protein [Pyrinomonadaceae bacterium]